MNLREVFLQLQNFIVELKVSRILGSYAHPLFENKNTNNDIQQICVGSENIYHILSGCERLANTDYFLLHNQVTNIIHQKLSLKFGLLHSYNPYYQYKPQAVLNNDLLRQLSLLSLKNGDE